MTKQTENYMEALKEKTFEQTAYEAKLTAFSIQFLQLIQAEIDLIDCGCKTEVEYLECVAFVDGLKKAISIFKELKEKQ